MEGEHSKKRYLFWEQEMFLGLKYKVIGNLDGLQLRAVVEWKLDCSGGRMWKESWRQGVYLEE